MSLKKKNFFNDFRIFGKVLWPLEGGSKKKLGRCELILILDKFGRSQVVNEIFFLNNLPKFLLKCLMLCRFSVKVTARENS